MPSRMLKMKASLPIHLEARLVNKWGYAIDKRVHGDFILFKKTYISDRVAVNNDGVQRTIRASIDKPTTTTTETKIVYPNFKTDLTPHHKKALEMRCDNIVNHFPDPYAVPESVRARLCIIMQRLTMVEAQFVLEYMDENFPIVEKA